MDFTKSADTKILESVLAEAVVGQTITYDALSQAIGRDVRQHASSALQTARKSVMKERGFVFGTEVRVGLVRLDDAGIVKSMERDRLHMQRTAKKSLRKLSVVDFANLPEDQKRSHIAASAQMGAIAMFSTKSASNKIETKVNGRTSELSIGETLKLFG